MEAERGGDGVRGKDRREAVSNHGSTFFFFLRNINQGNFFVFVDGGGCKADITSLLELLVHFFRSEDSLCVSAEIREQTITVVSSQ